MAKYTQEQRDEAVALFNELGSVTATIRRLGYPTRTMLYKWVSRDDAAHNRGEEARYLQYDPAVKATATRMCDSTHDARSVAKLYLVKQKSTGTSPNAELANSSLLRAVSQLREGEKPTCHSDRGAHYRWPGWLSICERAGITRSMSKKGCSPDNSACEGLFGRLKNEFFYLRNWQGVTMGGFMAMLNDYLEFYNDGRIKQSLGWMSPNEYDVGFEV